MQYLVPLAMYISFIMAIILILYAYYESLRLSNKEGKINGISFILLTSFGCLFSLLASHFHHLL
ncbi:hypothetical protein FZC66_18465 [Priestia megaterium]|nr:hypothetical protein FZC66_18465 [Priestia megaterium]